MPRKYSIFCNKDRVPPRVPFHQRMTDIFFNSDLEATTLLLTVAAFTWSILLLYHTELIQRPNFHLLRIIAPEWLWGIAFCIQGCSFGYALLTLRRSALLFATGPLLACLTWLTSSLAIMFTGVDIPAIVLSGLFCAIGSFWILVRYTEDK